jgi:D-lactate dehydrogenase (cytochrome)
MSTPALLPLDARFQDYLGDESGLRGRAESISFPESESEVQAVVARARAAGLAVTPQGGRTGLAGGAVPAGGHILNFSRMNRVKAAGWAADGRRTLTVEPGLTLAGLALAVRRLDRDPAHPGRTWFWPPDPSEGSATVGGVVACGARGMTAHRYGETLGQVLSARVVDSRGQLLEIRRGPGQDPHAGTLDLHLGAEGTLGALTELTLVLAPEPAERWGIAFFFTEAEAALRFAAGLAHLPASVSAFLAGADLLDRATLELVRGMRPELPALQALPAPPAEAAAMAHLELHAEGPGDAGSLALDPGGLEACAEALLDLAQACGADPEATWAVTEPIGVERLRGFRHAASEAAHRRQAQARRAVPQLTWLDIGLGPGPALSGTWRDCSEQLRQEGLAGCLCGEILADRLLVSFLPDGGDAHERCARLARTWSGGPSFQPHGAGKLHPAAGALAPRLEAQRRLKRQLDPEDFWNPGTRFRDPGGPT